MNKFRARGNSHKYATLLLTSCLLAGCATGSGLPVLAQAPAVDYRLGAGDQVRIITFDESQLTNTFVVGADGKISFPLLGDISASGLTTSQLAADISGELKKGGYITAPSVSAQVTEYRPISVLGEVNHPGQYPYQPGMTMLDAVALAGGFTYRAVSGSATDWRQQGDNSGNAVEGELTPGSTLQPGDVLSISERYF
jgi:polysaccharide export outer membrane protein